MALVCLPSAASAADCPGDLCPVTEQIQPGGKLADSTGDGRVDSSFKGRRLNSQTVEISLVTFGGRTLWSFPIAHKIVLPGEEPFPNPATAGEFTGDGVPDYAFAARGPIAGAEPWGGFPQTWSQPALVDGATGKVSYPLPAIDNRRWDFTSYAGPTAKYPTHRYSGFVQIGDFNTAYHGREVVIIPTYAPEGRGWVLNWDHSERWRKVEGRNGATSLLHPSEPEFESHYNAANPGSPCKHPFTLTTCHVQDSHVPTGLIINSRGWRNLFSMTSGRALLYRSDLTPTADTVWQSGDTPNGGRNKGYSYSFSHDGHDYAALLGGCAVKVARASMKSGAPPSGLRETSLDGVDAHCGIHRHYASFEIDGQKIKNQFNRYYSYSGDRGEGFFHNRIEFPNNPVGPVGGSGTHWQVYNLYRAEEQSTGPGHWELQVIRDPARPQDVDGVPGWYVWDAVDLDHDGQSELLATRTPADGPDGYVLPWETDVLRWNGSAFVSVDHEDGVAPALFTYPNMATRYADGGRKREGTILRDVDSPSDGIDEVMVEDEDGDRSYLKFSGL